MASRSWRFGNFGYIFDKYPDKLISPTLSSYDQYLADTPVEYIGYFACIRACKKREDR